MEQEINDMITMMNRQLQKRRFDDAPVGNPRGGSKTVMQPNKYEPCKSIILWRGHWITHGF